MKPLGTAAALGYGDADMSKANDDKLMTSFKSLSANTTASPFPAEIAMLDRETHPRC
jgi:hypothetical protein